MNIQNNIGILILSGLLSVSEILPFINNTKGNGVLHYFLNFLKNMSNAMGDTNTSLINNDDNLTDVDEIINISNQLKELKSELFLYLDSYNDYQNKNNNEYNEIIFQHLKDLQRKFDNQTNKLNEYISFKLNEQIDNKLNTYIDNINGKLINNLNDKLVEDLNKKLLYNFNDTLIADLNNRLINKFNENCIVGKTGDEVNIDKVDIDENKKYFEKVLNNNNENCKLILENCSNNEILAVLNEMNDVLKKRKKMNFFHNTN